ncbi:MAG: GAF domain-containing protein [Anaerolineae bacterium]|nr:GAF domain-containing protein [Anaerolineae bacterium]
MSTLRFVQQENARLKEENEVLREENLALRRYIGALEELHWVTQKIVSEENLINLLDQILRNAMGLLKAQGGSLLIRDEETNELGFVVVHGDIGKALQGYRLKGDEGIAGWVATHRKALVVNNPRQDRRFSPQVDEVFGFFTRSILCVPMITRNKVIGVIQLINKQNGDEFAEADVALLSILGHVAATALEQINLQLEAEEVAREIKKIQITV